MPEPLNICAPPIPDLRRSPQLYGCAFRRGIEPLAVLHADQPGQIAVNNFANLATTLMAGGSRRVDFCSEPIQQRDFPLFLGACRPGVQFAQPFFYHAVHPASLFGREPDGIGEHDILLAVRFIPVVQSLMRQSQASCDAMARVGCRNRFHCSEFEPGAVAFAFRRRVAACVRYPGLRY